MADLKTDYKDDIIDSSVNVNRTFSIIDNTTGTVIYPNVSLEETTVFTQEGDIHSASVTNAQNEAINELNNDLNDFSFRLNDGKPEFSTDGGTTWTKIGGGSMPLLDWNNPIATLSGSTTTFTATKPCYIAGVMWGSDGQTLTINSKVLTRVTSLTNAFHISPIKINTGDVVTSAGSGAIYVLDELS